MNIEKRDITKRGWKQDEDGTTVSEEQINDPLLAIEVDDVDAHSVEHVRVCKVWFVRAPEREQARLKREWAARSS